MDRRRKLEADIATNENEENSIKRVMLNYEVTEELVRDLISHLFEKGAWPKDEQAEIQYNKSILPPFFAKHIFYLKYRALEIQRISSTREQFVLFCKDELDKIRKFFISHSSELYCYYSKMGHRDRLLFTSRAVQDNSSILPEYPLFDCQINSGCLLVACFLAYQEYGRSLQEEIAGACRPLTVPGEKMETNATETELVELAMALHAAGVFSVDGYDASQEYIINWVRGWSGQALKNWQQLASNIRNRKLSNLKFLERLKNGLAGRNDRILLDRSRQRRLGTK